MTRFVILAVPRTGSNLLCTLLNSHSQILCHHEIFNPQGVFTALDYRGQELAVESLEERDADPLAFLSRVWQTGRDGSCVGFKWTRGQNEEIFNNAVRDSGVKKVVLRRRNRIKTYVSEKIAQETQQWEVYSRQDLQLPRPQVHVDPAQLLDHIATNQRFYAKLSTELSNRRQPHLQVEFETLFDQSSQRRLLEFLEVSLEELPLAAASIKQNSTDLRDSIENFVELDSCLTDRELITELHDRGI